MHLLKYQGGPFPWAPNCFSSNSPYWAIWFLAIQPKLSSKSHLFLFLGIHEQECTYFHKMYISKSNGFYYPFCRIFTQSKLILSHSSPNNHGSSFLTVSQAAPLYYRNLPRAENAPIIVIITIISINTTIIIFIYKASWDVSPLVCLHIYCYICTVSLGIPQKSMLFSPQGLACGYSFCLKNFIYIYISIWDWNNISMWDFIFIQSLYIILLYNILCYYM